LVTQTQKVLRLPLSWPWKHVDGIKESLTVRAEISQGVRFASCVFVQHIKDSFLNRLRVVFKGFLQQLSGLLACQRFRAAQGARSGGG
jgi:hypothetical protein